MIRKPIIILFVSMAIAGLVGLGGCANIIPPTGGPKDTLAPVLVTALPKDSTLYFNSKKIVLNFDEYVQLSNNFNEEIIVSPNPASPPLIESKLKTVSIKLRDSLRKNTTYTINFGKAIQDVNEANVVKNLMYVFSTGNTIDNGRLSGKVLLAETGNIDSTLIVLLHRNLQDSAVEKLRPDYYAKLDGKGNFIFYHLPNETFNVYVLPNDYSKKYDDSTKMFAFLQMPVNVDSMPQNLTMYAFQEFKPTEKTTPPAPKKPGKKEEEQPLRISFSTSGIQDLLETLSIFINKKVASFDTAKIILSDTNYKTIPGVTWVLDSTAQVLEMRYTWEPGKEYMLIVEKEALKDSSGQFMEKADTLAFHTKPLEDYGNILLRFTNLDLSKNPVLQFVQDNKIVDSFTLVKNEWSRKVFPPGDYTIRILYDENKNGTWDPGSFKTKKEPEITISLPRKITIKADWDNEADIRL